MKVTEAPFENTARWPAEMQSVDQLKNPYQAGSSVMSQKMFMQQKRLVESLRVR